MLTLKIGTTKIQDTRSMRRSEKYRDHIGRYVSRIYELRKGGIGEFFGGAYEFIHWDSHMDEEMSFPTRHEARKYAETRLPDIRKEANS